MWGKSERKRKTALLPSLLTLESLDITEARGNGKYKELSILQHFSSNLNGKNYVHMSEISSDMIYYLINEKEYLIL